MRSRPPLATAILAATCLAAFPPHRSVAGPQAPANNPDAILDLMTREGLGEVRGQWRFAEARIIEADSPRPGAPRTHDIEPKAGAAEFDDSGWETIDATALGERRGGGKLAFAWYRIAITVPPTVGGLHTAGTTIVLDTTVDDYAEIWVDGRFPVQVGRSGGNVIGGFNAPNRVVLTRDARPGQTIHAAVFAINGPLSSPPANFVWLRSATLDFYEPGRFAPAQQVAMTIDRRGPAMDAIVPPDAALERLADGFSFTEGPVWMPAQFAAVGGQPLERGHLLFSDPNRNVIQRWDIDAGVRVFREKSGYTGADIAQYKQPGSNGLAIDAQGRLTICEHGNRRITRLEHNGDLTILADRYQGKRLNSPNDLVYRSDGALFFTDPPFGLPNFDKDPRRESPHAGVYGIVGGELKLLSTDLAGPNGVAFSPDERFLYVTNWDEHKKVVMRYECDSGGALTNGMVFFDMTSAPGDEALDGIKVDERGDLFVSGPGGVWVISADGAHLGAIVCPELPANMAWGDEDGRALYLCARTGLYRLRLQVGGQRR